MKLQSTDLPKAIDLEQELLSSAIKNSRTCDEMIDVILLEDIFYDLRNRYLYRAMKSLREKSNPISPTNVKEELSRMKKLKSIGGEAYLVDLIHKSFSSAHLEYQSRILIQKYLARQIVSICRDVISKALDESTDVFHLIDDFLQEINILFDSTINENSSMTWGNAISSIPKDVEYLTNRSGKLTGVPTGLSVTNRHFNGWQKSDLIVLGADSGMGKTAFVVNNLLACAKQGIPVAMFSMEMSTKQLGVRAVSVSSNFHLNQLMRSGLKKPKQFDDLLKVTNSLLSLPIYIDDQPSMTIERLKRKARMMKRNHKVELIVVDFIQMFSGGKDIRISISEAARELKNLAKELNIAILVISQLSREVRRSPLNIPSKHHLKESSSIEEAADIILLIYRPGYYFNPQKDSSSYKKARKLVGIKNEENAALIVAKNRNGALGTIGLKFEANKTKFVDV